MVVILTSHLDLPRGLELIIDFRLHVHGSFVNSFAKPERLENALIDALAETVPLELRADFCTLHFENTLNNPNRAHAIRKKTV